MKLTLYIGGGTIADMVEQAKRGKAMSGFAMGPIVGYVPPSLSVGTFIISVI